MKKTEKQIADFLSGNQDIAVAFLFGSLVSGRLKPESDVDIAVLYSPGSVPSYNIHLELKDDLSQIIKREADIVVLNNASPIIKMQVLKNGKKIVEQDSQVYSDFFVRTINEYDDLKRVRAINEKNILKGRIYG